MTKCDVRMPNWKSPSCPEVDDASHVCRRCKLQKLSEQRMEELSKAKVVPSPLCGFLPAQEWIEEIDVPARQ